MKNVKARGRNLRLVLAEAHRRGQNSPPHPSPNWRKGVMSRLPNLEVLEPPIDQWAVMERLLWRFIPAAGALTLFLAILVSQFGPDRTEELARIMSADSAGSGLYAFYQRGYSHE